MSNIPQDFEDLALFASQAEIASRPGFLENGKLASITFYDRKKPRREGAAIAILHSLSWLDEAIPVAGWHWSYSGNTEDLMLIFDPTDTERLDYLLREGMSSDRLVEQLSGYLDTEQKRFAIDDAMQPERADSDLLEKQILRKLTSRLAEARVENA